MLHCKNTAIFVTAYISAYNFKIFNVQRLESQLTYNFMISRAQSVDDSANTKGCKINVIIESWENNNYIRFIDRWENNNIRLDHVLNMQ